MSLTDKKIIKFQSIFERDFGKKMNREEVIESATNLIQYFETALPIAQRMVKKNPELLRHEVVDKSISKKL